MYRNQVKWQTSKAKRAREAKVVRDAKKNPKALFQYVASISNLSKSHGTLTEDDQGKASVLSAFFGSVFTKEDLTNVPVLMNDNILSSLSVSQDNVCKSLK